MNVLLFIIGVASFFLPIGFSVLAPETATRLTIEEGPIENSTAICFGLAFLICSAFALFARSPRIWYLLLWAFLSLLFFGEEASWGQRWFGFETPAVLSDNLQGEATLHNLPIFSPRIVDSPLDLLTSQGAFYFGFFVYFLLAPILLQLGPLKRLGSAIRFPPIPLKLLVVIWAPVLVSFGLAAAASFGPMREALTEVREFHFALSILLYCLMLAFPARSPTSAPSTTAKP